MWVLVLNLLAKVDLVKHWKALVIVGLVLLQLTTAYGWYHEHGAFKAEQASHRADIATYKVAQKAAEKLANDTKQQLEKKNKDLADEADKNYGALLNQYRASLMRYSTVKGVSGQSGYSQPPSVPEGGHGPGESAQLPSTIVITIEDADTCAVNTARLKAVHDWALEEEKSSHELNYN